MIKKIFIFVAIINLLSSTLIAEDRYEIVVSIDNKVITNFDIQKEINYLLALNPSLNNLPKKQIYEIAKESLVREEIKEKEILKYYNINYKDPELSLLIENIYNRLNIANENEFNKYLSNFDLSIEIISAKLAIEKAWNRLIFEKFNQFINLDELRLKKELEKNLSQPQTQNRYLISEILFQSKDDKEYQEILRNIKKTIKENSFETAASIYSISDSSKNGGEIGWVNKNEISDTIYNVLSKLSIGQFTQPIKIASGFLIIYLNDIKKEEQEFNVDEELKKMIISEKNRQFNEFSIIHFKKIEQQIFINEK
ncbi:MAG: peptidylprolyl isomerase [Candidatus Pelagibacter bacterium]|nr:peptidylprolyl isomerase [Candidatus Pelagibacter bacterium]